MKLKKKLNSLAFIVPVIALSFFLIPSADAQHRKKKGGGSGISIHIGGYGGHSGYYGGYNPYRSYNTSRYYKPKTYRVSVLYYNQWHQKYCGTCAKTAYATANYYRSRGIPVRY